MATFTTGTFTSTGAAPILLALESGFDLFTMVNVSDVGSTSAETQVMRAYYASLMPPDSAYRNLKTNGANTLALETSFIGRGFTAFDSNNPPVFAATAVTAITAASPASVSSVAHGLAVGDTVMFSGLNGSMTGMNGLKFTVNSITSADVFTITFDASAAGAGQIGVTPATAGFVTKVFGNPFSPHNVVIGPTATMSAAAGGGVTIVDPSNILLNMNAVPSFEQSPSQYTPFQRPYQVGAKLRLYIPTGYGTPQTANFIMGQIVAVNTQTGYAVPNQLQLRILPGNLSGAITTAVGLAALVWPAGGVGFKKSYPFVTDIAEASAIFSEAEDNTAFRGILIGTGVLGLGTGVATTARTYQWFALKGYTLTTPVAPGN